MPPTSPTSPTPNRAKRRQQKTQQILDAAMSLVIERGIEALTVQSLAHETHCTPGALYRYFASKDEILASLDVQILGDFIAILTRGLDLGADHLRHHPLDPITAALFPPLLLCDLYGQLADLQPRQFHILCLLASTPRHWVKDHAAVRVIGPAMQLLSLLATRLEAAADVGALHASPAPLERTFLLWSSIHSLQERRKLGRLMPTSVSIHHLHDTLTATLLLGWGAPPDALARARASVSALNTPTWVVARCLAASPLPDPEPA